VPAPLRDAHYKGAEQMGHGTEYKYSHDYEGGYVQQQYLPEDRRYYEPVDRGFEAEIKRRLDSQRAGSLPARHEPAKMANEPEA
jgi:putative ATPase